MNKKILYLFISTIFVQIHSLDDSVKRSRERLANSKYQSLGYASSEDWVSDQYGLTMDGFLSINDLNSGQEIVSYLQDAFDDAYANVLGSKIMINPPKAKKIGKYYLRALLKFPAEIHKLPALEYNSVVDRLSAVIDNRSDIDMLTTIRPRSAAGNIVNAPIVRSQPTIPAPPALPSSPAPITTLPITPPSISKIPTPPPMPSNNTMVITPPPAPPLPSVGVSKGVGIAYTKPVDSHLSESLHQRRSSLDDDDDDSDFQVVPLPAEQPQESISEVQPDAAVVALTPGLFDEIKKGTRLRKLDPKEFEQKENLGVEGAMRKGADSFIAQALRVIGDDDNVDDDDDDDSWEDEDLGQVNLPQRDAPKMPSFGLIDLDEDPANVRPSAPPAPSGDLPDPLYVTPSAPPATPDAESAKGFPEQSSFNQVLIEQRKAIQDAMDDDEDESEDDRFLEAAAEMFQDIGEPRGVSKPKFTAEKTMKLKAVGTLYLEALLKDDVAIGGFTEEEFNTLLDNLIYSQVDESLRLKLVERWNKVQEKQLMIQSA